MKRTGIDLDLVPNIQNWKGSRFVVAPGDLDLPVPRSRSMQMYSRSRVTL